MVLVVSVIPKPSLSTVSIFRHLARISRSSANSLANSCRQTQPKVEECNAVLGLVQLSIHVAADCLLYS